MWRSLAVCLGLVWWVVSVAEAKPHDDFDQRIVAELRQRDSALAEVFEQANAARAKGDHTTAEKLYANVFEYGHFSNRDTAGGGFALGVRRSLLRFIIGLAQSGHATPWNPAWWFTRGFYVIFLRVSQGASRLQEILADRRAAEAYGGLAFAHGLKHVLACDLRFDDLVNASIKRSLAQKEPRHGLWTPLAERGADANELSQALNREPSPYDSYPAPRDRIRWVEQLTGSVTVKSSAGATAWTPSRTARTTSVN